MISCFESLERILQKRKNWINIGQFHLTESFDCQCRLSRRQFFCYIWMHQAPWLELSKLIFVSNGSEIKRVERLGGVKWRSQSQVKKKKGSRAQKTSERKDLHFYFVLLWRQFAFTMTYFRIRKKVSEPRSKRTRQSPV